jgi:hypothetical protein
MLDIYNLNFQLCNENYGELNSEKDNLPQKGILLRIFSLFKGIFVHSILKKTTNTRIENNLILFFTLADNEKKSILPLKLKLSNSEIFGIDNFQNGYPLGQIYWFSLFFIPIVFFRYLFCLNPYHRKSYKYAFDGFCIAYSSNLILNQYLLRNKPKKIIITNQLSVFHRVLAYKCIELNIETIYIQHASLTENFSNLNIFSKVLLEGEDSLLKTQICGTTNKELYLVGVPKFDEYFKYISYSKGIKSIGICTNGMDDIYTFSELISFLKVNFPWIQISVRPHPADRRRNDWKSISVKYDCFFSDVFKIDSFDFLKNHDLLISGNSNIHLEAVLLNLPSIYFDPRNKKLDFYGFSKNNLVFYASDFYSIKKNIFYCSLEDVNVRTKAKYYVETVGSLFDGKSTELAVKIIQDENVETYFKKYNDNNNNIIFRVK